MVVKDPYPISQYLSLNGLGTGTIDAIGNYSAEVTKFYLACPAADRLHVSRMIVSIEDGSGMTATDYGTLGAPLANGIEVKILDSDNSVISDLTAGQPVLDNSGWGHLTYDVDVKAWGGAAPTNDVLVARWSFFKHGRPIILDAGQQLAVLVNDDFTGLVHHRFLAQGFYLNRGM